MQGHGLGQPVKQPPHTAWLVILRVLFVGLGILSIGFLSWAMLLRLAIVTRRVLDWCLFGAVLVTDIVSTALIGSEPGDEITTVRGNAGMILLLGTLVGTIAYYLAAEIRHYGLRQEAYAAQRPALAYSYPGPTVPTVPYLAPGVPTAPAPPVTPPVPVGPAAPVAPVPGPPQRPAPARIDQVRAELDELSDYLRKHDGRHEGHPEGGR
ncbi:hypothetical protein ACWCV9_28170 [Streptomyces sp. NPDC001606]